MSIINLDLLTANIDDYINFIMQYFKRFLDGRILALLKRTHKVLAAAKRPMLVGHNHGKPSPVTVIAHCCDHCDTKVTTNFMSATGCPVCANVMTPASSKGRDLSTADILKLNVIAACDNCGTDIRADNVLASSFHNHSMNCPVCMSKLAINSMDEEDEAEDDSEPMENVVEEVEDTDNLEDSSSAEEDASATTAGNYILSTNFFNKVINKEVKVKHVNLVMSGDKNPVWYLFANNQPIAISSKEKVKAELKPIFETDAFAKTFILATNKEGLTAEKINEFGFESIVVAQPIEAITKSKLDSAITAKLKEVEKNTNEIKATFEQTLGIAAVGINKNFFGKGNVLRSSFIETLSNLNIKNADKIVDRVLSKHGESYLREIVAKAMELQNKSTETLNEIATLVQTAEYKGSISNPSDEVVSSLSSGNIPLILSASSSDSDDEVENKKVSNKGYKNLLKGISRRI